MLLVGQRDARWSFKPIGKSKTTIGQAGCVISSLSMLSDWYGCYHDPAWMSKYLSFKEDMILWPSITDKLCFKFIWRQYGYNENKILNSLDGKGSSVLLRLHEGAQTHWVVAIKKVLNQYWVADPWTKTRHFVPKSWITGSAHFDAKQ